MRIAVVGAGIAGLYCAWRLAREHAVTLFEANGYPGGHTNTIDVRWDGRPYAVDTGFIVFNDRTYPNFNQLLSTLGVERQPSNMSFSLRCERTGIEYNGTSVNSLFAQRRNLLRPSFLRMIGEILRFNRTARRLLASDDDSLTLQQYLLRERYGSAFTERYLLPMGRAIWSAPAGQILDFPARMFVDFFDRHGFLEIDNRPQWYALCGGSREYVRRLLLDSDRLVLRLSEPVISIVRHQQRVSVVPARAAPETFDAVFLACHADDALRVLAEPTRAEREVLGAFPYAQNEAILHTDASVLPRRPLARAAWNYHLTVAQNDPVAVTYDMNVLQSLTAPVRFLVSLNHAQAIDPRQILRRIDYRHPVYLPAGIAAQKRHREIDGTACTYYCGAYWRYGFHEDGVVSALAALAHFEEDRAHAQRDLPRAS